MYKKQIISYFTFSLGGEEKGQSPKNRGGDKSKDSEQVEFFRE